MSAQAVSDRGAGGDHSRSAGIDSNSSESREQSKETRESKFNNDRTPLSSATRISYSNKSFIPRNLNNSISSLFSPSHGRNVSSSSSNGKLVGNRKGYLITVIPPIHLPHDPPHPRSGACTGYGPPSQFMRGCLLPLYPTLASQLGAIAREYGLLSTGGLVLYLLSTSDSSSSLSTALVGGPRISEEAWSMLFGRLLEEEGESEEEDAFIPPVPTLPTSHISNLSNLHNLRDHGTFPENHNPEQESSIVSDGTEFSTETTASIDDSNYSNTTQPENLKHSIRSSTSLNRSNPSRNRSSRSSGLSALNGMGSIVAKIEFDIDRRKGKWYEGFLAAATITEKGSWKENGVGSGSGTESPRVELQLPNILDQRNRATEPISSAFLPLPISNQSLDHYPMQNSPLVRVRSVGGSDRREGEFGQMELEEDPFRPANDSRENGSREAENESDHSSNKSVLDHEYAKLEDDEEDTGLLESENEATETLDDIFPNDELTWRALGVDLARPATELETVTEATGLGISGARIQERAILGQAPVGVIENLGLETEEEAGRVPPQDDVQDVLLLATQNNFKLLASPIHLSTEEGFPAFTPSPVDIPPASVPSPSQEKLETSSAKSSPRRHSDSPKTTFVPRHTPTLSTGSPSTLSRSTSGSPSNLPYARSPRMGNYFTGVPIFPDPIQEILELGEKSSLQERDSEVRSSGEIEDLDDLERVLEELSPKREKKADEASPVISKVIYASNPTSPPLRAIQSSSPDPVSPRSVSSTSGVDALDSELASALSPALSPTLLPLGRFGRKVLAQPELSIPLPPSPVPQPSPRRTNSQKLYGPASEQPYLSNHPEEEEEPSIPEPKPINNLRSAPPVPSKPDITPSQSLLASASSSSASSFSASKLKVLRSRKSKNGLSMLNTAGPLASIGSNYKPERVEKSEKSPINSFFSRLKTKKTSEPASESISPKTVASPTFPSVPFRRPSLDPNAVPFTLSNSTGAPFANTVLSPTRPERTDSVAGSTSQSIIMDREEYSQSLTSPRSDYGPPSNQLKRPERKTSSAPSTPASTLSHKPSLTLSMKKRNDIDLEDLLKTMKEIYQNDDLEDDFDIGVSESSNSLSTLSASGSGGSAESIGSLSYSLASASLGKENSNWVPQSTRMLDGEGKETLDML